MTPPHVLLLSHDSRLMSLTYRFGFGDISSPIKPLESGSTPMIDCSHE